MNRSPLASQHGTTLVESLVAIGLFAVAAATIGHLLTHHIRQGTASRRATTAISLAEQELERLRTIDYNDISSQTTVTEVDNASYTVRITASTDVPAANMKQIQADVSWTEPNGSQTYTVYAIYTAIKR